MKFDQNLHSKLADKVKATLDIHFRLDHPFSEYMERRTGIRCRATPRTISQRPEIVAKLIQ